MMHLSPQSPLGLKDLVSQLGETLWDLPLTGETCLIGVPSPSWESASDVVDAGLSVHSNPMVKGHLPLLLPHSLQEPQ